MMKKYYDNNIMDYSWKKFESVNQRLEHRITITRSGYIGFPTKFYADNKIAEYKYVVLYYSVPEKAIGIRFTNEEKEKGNIKIHHNKEGKGGWVVAKNFFKTNNLDYKNYSSRYDWIRENFEGIGKLFIIKLLDKSSSTLT